MSEILRAARSDAPAILKLQKVAYQREAALYDDWAIPPLTQTLEQLDQEFDERTFLKAADGSRLIGSVRASMHEGTCEIGRLIVHPESQRRGIGTRLLLAIEAEFPSAGRFELFTGKQERRQHPPEWEASNSRWSSPKGCF